MECRSKEGGGRLEKEEVEDGGKGAEEGWVPKEVEEGGDEREGDEDERRMKRGGEGSSWMGGGTEGVVMGAAMPRLPNMAAPGKSYKSLRPLLLLPR